MQTRPPRVQDVMNQFKNLSDFLNTTSVSELVVRLVNLSTTLGIDVLFSVGLVTFENRTFPTIAPGLSLRQKLRSTGSYSFSAYIQSALRHIPGQATPSAAKDVLDLDLRASDSNAKYDVHLPFNIGVLDSLHPNITAGQWVALFSTFLNKTSDKVIAPGLERTRDLLLEVGSRLGLPHVAAYLHLQVASRVLALDYWRMIRISAPVACLRAACDVATHSCARVIFEALNISTGNVVQPLYKAVQEMLVTHIADIMPWLNPSARSQFTRDVSETSVLLMDSPLVKSFSTGVNYSAATWMTTLESGNAFEVQYASLLASHKRISLLFPPTSQLEPATELQLKNTVEYSPRLEAVGVPSAFTVHHVLYADDLPR